MIERNRPILAGPHFYEIYQLLVDANYSGQVLVNKYIQPRPDDPILDIGCGHGNLIPFLPKRRCTGVYANQFEDHLEKGALCLSRGFSLRKSEPSSRAAVRWIRYYPYLRVASSLQC